MTQYFKFLNEDGTAAHGGSGKWHLPTAKRAGKWMPKIVNIKPCARGYHLCEAKDLLAWVAPALFVAELPDEIVSVAIYDDDGNVVGSKDTQNLIVADNKIVVSQARLLRRVETWNEKTARLFACDCAERVLPLFEKDCPNDARPRQAIETARKFANGKASQEKLAAARAAAWDAARAACDAACDATRTAACDAACAATRTAACDAARDACDAACDAARDACDAACAATRTAAGAAAWAVTRTAAGAAAWDAEKEWQTAHLLKMLGIRRKRCGRWFNALDFLRHVSKGERK